MKKYLLTAAFVLAALTASSSATASDPKLSGSVGVESSYVYRGLDLSTGSDVSLNASLRVDDAFVDGLYVRLNANTIDIEDDLTTGQARIDGGVGYLGRAGKVNYDISLNRVVNPVAYGYNYSEVRATVGYNVTEDFNIYTEIGQQVGDSVNEDTYLAVGAYKNDLFGVNNLKAGIQASGYRYNNAMWNDAKYNNTEVFVSYFAKSRYMLYGKYSFGGDGRAPGSSLDNVGSVGVRILF